jgi:hypothetical protein
MFSLEDPLSFIVRGVISANRSTIPVTLRDISGFFGSFVWTIIFFESDFPP